MKINVCHLFLVAILFFNQAFGSGDDKLNVGQDNAIVHGLLFQRFFTPNGLPDERIRSIFQDKRGFLWIGTMNGISRYDGYHFKNYYKTENAGSLSGNWAYAMAEDTQNNIWIATNNGFSQFDFVHETFTNYSLPKTVAVESNERVNTLVFDDRGMLWIGSTSGLWKFDPATRGFKKFSGFPLNKRVVKIIRSANGFLWVATDEGLVHFDLRSEAFTFHRLNVKASPYGDKFWSLLEMPLSKDLLIGTGKDGLLALKYDAGKKAYGNVASLNNIRSVEGDLSNTQVFDICLAKTGTLWLGTEKGLAKIEHFGQSNGLMTMYANNPSNNKSISNERVYSVFIDKTNVLWCGTEFGLNKLDLSALPFNYYTFTNQKSTDQVRGVSSLDGSEVSMATFKNGMYRYSFGTDRTQVYKFSPANSYYNLTRSVIEDEQHITYLGTLDGVVLIKNGQVLHTYLSGKAIFSMLKDAGGTIWIGTNSGLFTLDKELHLTDYSAKIVAAKKILTPFIRTISQDQQGNIWLGFENAGVAVIEAGSGKVLSMDKNNEGQQVFGKTVYSIIEYPKQVFWIGSESGLTKLTTGSKDLLDNKIENYSEKDGLPDKSVNGILADEIGHLWISTLKGLIKYTIETKKFQNYLPNLCFSHSCCFKQGKHKLFFGTSDGFIAFDPAAIVDDVAAPMVSISDLKLFNQSIDINAVFNKDVILTQSITATKEVQFNYRNNVFTIEFAAMHFANPEYNLFSYKLEGFDKNWIQTSSNNRSATYTNLDPGTYTFRLKAANYLGVWNNEPAVLKITILPPPWRTWWAYCIYFLLLVVAIAVFTRYTLLQISQRHQLQYEKIEKDHISKLNELKLQFFTDISHEFRTPLSLIIGPSQEILNSPDLKESIRTKVKFINRNSKRLLYLIDELMTFQKLDQGKLRLKPQQVELVGFIKEIHDNFEQVAQKKEIKFGIYSDMDNYWATIDPGKMEMVLNNLLFNAFKFVAHKGTINIKIKRVEVADLPEEPVIEHKEWLSVSVEDNGKGISREDFEHLFERYFQSRSTLIGTGVGLSLTKNLVELHNGMITAESDPGVKTSFVFFLPYDKTIATPKEAPIEHPDYATNHEVSELFSETVIDHPELDEEMEHTRPLLLLVDDNVEVLEYLEMLFKDKYDLAKATNGVEALQYIGEHEPDLVISDLMMPEMDGNLLCKRIKSEINTSHIPVIMLTAKSTFEDEIVGLKTGADDYIAKPFHPDVLKLKVYKLIEAKRRLFEELKNANTGYAIPKDITKNPLDEEFLKNVLDGIYKNLDNDEFTVEDLGSIVAMSRSNLFRKLKAITGQTPIEFIYNIRLKKSMEMLLERKMSISQISFEVGFKSPSSFTKSFKKHFGKSPTDFLSNAIAEAEETKHFLGNDLMD